MARDTLSLPESILGTARDVVQPGRRLAREARRAEGRVAEQQAQFEEDEAAERTRTRRRREGMLRSSLESTPSLFDLLGSPQR